MSKAQRILNNAMVGWHYMIEMAIDDGKFILAMRYYNIPRYRWIKRRRNRWMIKDNPYA